MKTTFLFFATIFILSFNGIGQIPDEVEIILPGLNKEGEIFLDDLLKVTELKTNNENYEVVSFSFIVMLNDESDLMERFSEGNKLSESQYSILKRLHNSDSEKNRMFIAEIKVKDSEGMEHNLKAIQLFVKKKPDTQEED